MACVLDFVVWNINSVKPQNSSHDFVCIYSASMCISPIHSCNINYIFGMESFSFVYFCVRYELQKVKFSKETLPLPLFWL